MPIHHSSVDNLISGFDRILRTLTPGATTAKRPYPGKLDKEQHELLSDTERQLSESLMRVNHTGEVCAQALYQGQALTARNSSTKDELALAAKEEEDHLAWCEKRLKSLHGRTSYLNPIFYKASFTLGAVTGLMGDKISLGFVGETEKQVCDHLKDHLERLPVNDVESRAVVEKMIEDEERHGQTAMQSGGQELPAIAKKGMSLVSKVMTTLSHRI